MAILSTGAGVGTIFHPWVRARVSFFTRGDPRISEISDFDGFGIARPPKFPPVLKFWLSPTIFLTQVLYRNLRLRSSYSPIMFFS
jgi:hypothetical protein